MNKQDIKNWLDANVWDGEDRSGAKNDRASFSPDDLQELVEELVQDLAPKWVSVDTIDLKEGDEWLCMLHGKRVVLTLRYETPTHEETFKPYFYWYEDTSDMLMPEWSDVTHVYSLPTAPEVV